MQRPRLCSWSLQLRLWVAAAVQQGALTPALAPAGAGHVDSRRGEQAAFASRRPLRSGPASSPCWLAALTQPGACLSMPQLIRGLEAARGNGTSMISLIMHPRDQARTELHHARPLPPWHAPRELTCKRNQRTCRGQVSKVAAMLANEFGTASNIKNRVNRQVRTKQCDAPLPRRSSSCFCLTPCPSVAAVRAGSHHLRAAALEVVQQGAGMHAWLASVLGPLSFSLATAGASQRPGAVHGDHPDRRG
jgi:hypothetical protein